jgi:hypothetical protein
MWPQSPGLFTRIMAITVRPRNTSRLMRRPGWEASASGSAPVVSRAAWVVEFMAGWDVWRNGKVGKIVAWTLRVRA